MRTSTRGFTLIELITVLAVLAIVAGLAAPPLSAAVKSHRAAAAASELQNSLALARLSSIARSQVVTTCPSRDGLQCTGDTDWSVGWIVFADRDRKMQPKADNLLIRHEPIPAGIAFQSSAGRTYVRFQPSGFASGTNLTVAACASGLPGVRLVMNNAGRVRVERAATCGIT